VIAGGGGGRGYRKQVLLQIENGARAGGDDTGIKMGVGGGSCRCRPGLVAELGKAAEEGAAGVGRGLWRS
jgi:hypothetical protein